MEPPIKPDESDCCNSGCSPCILDVYEDQMKKYIKLKEANAAVSATMTNCLSTTSYSIFGLIDIEEHGLDAYLFTFEYIRSMKRNIASDDADIIYHPGQYFLLKAGNENDEFTRAYTPIPNEKTKKLQFTSLIKLYDNGKMSDYIRRQFSLGLDTYWRGPYGESTVSYDNKHMLLIAQGTGIAPIYSIISDILKNENCYTFLKLFYCCRNCNTIYLHENLYKLQSNWNFTYEIFLGDSANISKKYNELVHSFKLNEEAIKCYLVDKLDNVQVLVSGSKIFMGTIKGFVEKSQVSKEKIFLF